MLPLAVSLSELEVHLKVEVLKQSHETMSFQRLTSQILHVIYVFSYYSLQNTFLHLDGIVKIF